MTPRSFLHRRLAYSALTLFLLALTPRLQASDRMVPGQWEFTMTTDGASHSATHCVTALEASEVNGDSTSGRAYAEKKAAGHCAIKAFQIQGLAVTYTLSCGNRTIDSTGTYHGETYEGVLKTTVEGKVATTQVKARRLGSCP